MGILDESDDDDNEEQQHNMRDRGRRMAAGGSAGSFKFASWPGVPQQEDEKQQPRKDGDKEHEAQDAEEAKEEEEEDPLDAYMKSLEQQQQQQQQPSSTATLNSAVALRKKHERMDLENEDHDDHDDGHDTFAKSGALSKHRRDDDEWESSSSLPTPTTTHTSSSSSSSSSLSTWRKVFWTVQNTVQGRTWRAHHDVSCSVAVDPLYHDFNNLLQKELEPEDGHYNNNNNNKTNHHPEHPSPFFYFNPAFLHETLYQLGFAQPTIVQSQTMPVVLSGRNVLVTAATGQGKTLAYAWPMMIHVLDQPALQSSTNETGPLALILVPTRELALQVNKQVEVLFKAAAGVATVGAKTIIPLLTTRAVIGGVGKYILYQQLKKSGGVHVVVVTPGRLLDVLSDNNKKGGGLNLQRVTMLILDEMDKMLAMGFVSQVRLVLSALPQPQQQQPSRQTLMFSATLGKRVENVAKEWLSSSSSSSSSQPYVRIAVGQVGECSTSVQQHVMVLPNEQAKEAFLIAMLPTLQDVGRTLIFCATRQGCEHLAKVILQSNNHNNNSANNNTYSASSSGSIGAQTEGDGDGGRQVVKLEIIHGERHQSDRVKALKAFTQGRVHVLIATDVAGRGLDVPNVATVINFDPAKNMDSHVHRIGRAGRISKQQINKKKASIGDVNNSSDVGDDDNDNDTACTSQQQQQPQEGTAYTLLTPRNVDFALALRNALSRQGRPISQDLNDLANQSRKGANGNKRSNTSRESSSAAYYAPSQSPSESAPPQKHSRWA